MLLANLLTALRIPLAFAFWVVANDPPWAVGVIGAAAATDAVDGTIARRARRRGASPRSAEIGAWLDPMCDKIFAGSVLIALYVVAGAPALLLLAIATRELIVVPMLVVYEVFPNLRRVHWDFTASRLGKVTTIVQFFALGAVALDVTAQWPLAGAAAGLGLAAGLLYLRHALAVRAMSVAARRLGAR